MRAFGRFWYDFVVGDDWRVAFGVAAALGVTALLADGGIPTWWLLPLLVVAVLAASVWRVRSHDLSDGEDLEVTFGGAPSIAQRTPGRDEWGRRG
ncbi:MAG: hypothetical protein JO265_01850 [Acidimicrobiia bacterium]|nr:hypothetical protein [Acidimicrobiia bacterium]